MDLDEVVSDIADALVRIDKSGEPFRTFKPGVGPYGEPQLISRIASRFNELPKYHGAVRTKRTPDLLIPNEWAVEFKITRPYGDNGKEAENWSVNLLHPYPGNVSTVGDCYKLARLQAPERKAVAVIGYEHAPVKIDLTPLIESFEAIRKSCGSHRAFFSCGGAARWPRSPCSPIGENIRLGSARPSWGSDLIAKLVCFGGA